MFSFLPSLNGQFWAKASDGSGSGTAGGNSGIDRLGTIWQKAANLANDDDGMVSSLNGQTDNNNKDDFGEYSVADAEAIAQQSMLPTFERTGQNDAKMAAVLLCDVLGALCILLNAFVIVALIRNRRRVLVNVFYVLVLHCAIVDLIRGGCLIAWGMPHLLIHTMRSIQDRLLALKINQFTLLILRSCNLLTIFNLLVFTTNEFIVIKYPLHYRRYFRRRTVLVILAICWLVSLLFGIGSVFSNFFESAHTVMVRTNGTMDGDDSNIFAEIDNAEDEDEDEERQDAVGQMDGEEANAAERILLMRFGPRGNGVTRRQMAGLSINVLSMLMIFVLCYVCLFTVLVCYGKILRTIRQFQKCGGGGPRRVLKESTTTAPGEEGSKRFARTGSIYHKRSVHQQRTQQQITCQGSSTSPPTTIIRAKTTPKATVIGVDQHQQQQGNGVAAAQPEGCCDQRLSSLKKKVSMPSSPQSGTSGSGGGDPGGCGTARCPNCQLAEDGFHRNRRCNSHRKWRSHLMSRHKYLIVIGTVLFVDVLFLFPYSGIQMVALLHLNNLLATSQLTTLIRWGLQILIGVHSVCQPLCYFRMTEFRRLACCLGGTGGSSSRRWGGSGSSAGSIFAAPQATFSRSAKSIGSVKTFGLTREDDGSIAHQKKSIVLSTLVSEGSPLVAGGTHDENSINGGAGGRGGGTRRDRTNWVNPSVGERQMLLIAQRRKWTRNLSLLCKEEGEELEVFLSREYKRREDQQGQTPIKSKGPGATFEHHRRQQQRMSASSKRRSQKGGSLRDRTPPPCEEIGEEKISGTEEAGKGAFILDKKKSEEMLEKGEIVENVDKAVDIDVKKANEEAKWKTILEEKMEDKQQENKSLLTTNEKGNENEEQRKTIRRGDGFRYRFGRFLTRIGRRIGRGGHKDGEGDEDEPTLLDSDWKRPGEVHQFRSYGPTNTELRPKISDLSGLRSNSVFTPLSQSVNASRQPSTQWGNSGATGTGHGIWSGWKQQRRSSSTSRR